MIRLGIVGCSEIAFRRFLPALTQVDGITAVAVAEEFAPDRLDLFCKTFGMETLSSFDELLRRDDIDAFYIPQPPALHYQWARMALLLGKHVLVEKPSTTSYDDSVFLVDLAAKRHLALHENFMFQYHSQIAYVRRMMEEKIFGDPTVIRINFGFPLRQKNDFRYSVQLGGGALLDAGVYTLKLASILLGDSVWVDTASLKYLAGYEVDMLGTGTLKNSDGLICQVAFGMNCTYQCSLEIWGSKARLFTKRILTAPPEVRPVFYLEDASGIREIELENDSSFKHSIETFLEEIKSSEKREEMYKEICLQAKLVDEFRQKAENSK